MDLMTEPIALTERQAQRLLERLAQAGGARMVADAAVAAADAADARYREEIATLVDVPDGTTVHVDFKARTITVVQDTS
jgi:hypothetical protein